MTETDATHAAPPAAGRSTLHGPDSLTIRLAGDRRMGLMSGRTFVMQVAHPAVGAGVGRFSPFREDPWTRLEKITQSGIRYLYRGEAAGFEEGRRLRRAHRDIHGVDAHGRPYHSLDPDVYGWVHTVFFDSIVTMCELFADPLGRAQEEQLFDEWRQGGRVYGLRDEDMPASVEAYRRFWDDRIENLLEHNDVMDWMLSLHRITPPPPPGFARLPDPLWRALWRPVGSFNRRLVLGTLPPAFRAKIADRHPWTPEDQRRFDRFARRVRRWVPRLPEPWRTDPDAASILRRREAA